MLDIPFVGQKNNTRFLRREKCDSPTFQGAEESQGEIEGNHNQQAETAV